MTNYLLHTSLPCHSAIIKALTKCGTQRRLTLGLDLELANPAGALLIGGGAPLYLGKHSREVWIELVRWLLKEGCEVHCAQEACGFGWEFHRALATAGAHSSVVAPQEMSGKRKTDKRDACALATLLWDYVVNGNHKNLKVVRPPSQQEQEQRSYHRKRSQWVKMRCQLEAHGRSLMWDHSWLQVPQGWWKASVWKKLKDQLLSAGRTWLAGMLEALQSTAQSMSLHIDQLAQQARLKVDKAASQPSKSQSTPAPEAAGLKEDSAGRTPLAASALPKGLGTLSYAILHAEVVDWGRFKNRAQPGSFIGCCPREYSSGTRQKLGEIDRNGNARVRTTLVEAAWRLLKWSPNWRGFRKFAGVLSPGAKVGGGRKRKAIVACARLLMVDLWRLHMGTATLEGLGLTPASK